MLKFALAGNPNCGKTTLFNALTGSTAHVGNWPGVTVDKKEGTYKKLSEHVSIVDLPGIYSLSPYTPEEVIARNYILEDAPDCIINIVDATNLERNLYLSTQIAEIDVPMVIALNMMDIIMKNGESLDINMLESEIGVPVVPISAQKGEGIEDLMNKAYAVSKTNRAGKTVIESGPILHLIQDCKAAFTALNIPNPLFHAIKLIENDEIESQAHPDLVRMVEEFKKNFNDETFGNDLEAVVADSRYQYISKNYSKAKEKNAAAIEEKLTNSDKADKILTHRIWGIPIFLVILFLVFHLTFSENLFWLGGALKLPTFNEGGFFEGLFYDGGIMSPGVILANFLGACTDGLSGVIAGWLSNAPGWVSGLLVDGICAGVFSVLSFIPQILLLFLFFSILEDTGYMARVAFILDRIFRKFGLSGRTFMPMIMGFGCAIPAMINTRTLAEENERTATVRVIPFFSCGAKLPILTAIAGAICVIFDFPNADLITYAMYLIGMITAIVTIIIMRNTSMRGKTAPFIMELPTYHAPQVKALAIHLWDKLKHYVKKAFTIILASTIIIWFLQSFTWKFQYIEMASPVDVADEIFDEKVEENAAFKTSLLALNEDFLDEEGNVVGLADVMAAYGELEDDAEIQAYTLVLTPVFEDALTAYKDITLADDYLTTSNSILASFGKVLKPICTPMGFGMQLNENGWTYPVAAVTGLIAKENVIATFGVLAQSTNNDSAMNASEYMDLYVLASDEEGVSASVSMINNTGITWAAAIAFIVFNMTTIPCFAAVATAKGELNKKKFWTTIGFWLATSFITSTIVYLVLSFWWTSFIIAALAILAGFGIYYYNKAKDNKVLCNQ